MEGFRMLEVQVWEEWASEGESTSQSGKRPFRDGRRLSAQGFGGFGRQDE